MRPSHSSSKFLLWGGNGWIAGLLNSLLVGQGENVQCTTVRMEDQEEMFKALDELKPTHVINCAGMTGRPNIDALEEQRLETIRSNVIGTLMLADACEARGIHMTVLATGCIYASTYTPDFTTLLSDPFSETDRANFEGSFYSYTKSRVEDVLKFFPHALVLRLRMPVSDDLHPRSFVTKIKGYAKVVNVPNSHTILYDLLPVVVALAEHRETGVYNFTNPGAATHNEVLGLYREIVDPAFTWENFTVEEQSRVVRAERSNCALDCEKLLAKVKEYVGAGWQLEVPEIHEAYRRCFGRMKAQMQQRPGAQVLRS